VTVGSGGTELVLSGGTVASSTIVSGGTEVLAPGAVVSGGISFSGTGGVLVVSGSTMPAASIGGFQSGVTIDLANVAFVSGATATLNAGTDVLTVTEAGSSYALQLSGSYLGSNFTLASDGVSGTDITGGTLGTLIDVSTEAQLNQAIATVDGAASGAYEILFTNGITEGSDLFDNIIFNGGTLSASAPEQLYAFNLASGVSVTLDGAGYTLNGDTSYQGLFVYQGDVTVENLTITGALAHGGDGGAGHEYDGGGARVSAAASSWPGPPTAPDEAGMSPSMT
jgi:autotransporter passenger strand-loop-strand repeat protein